MRASPVDMRGESDGGETGGLVDRFFMNRRTDNRDIWLNHTNISTVFNIACIRTGHSFLGMKLCDGVARHKTRRSCASRILTSICNVEAPVLEMHKEPKHMIEPHTINMKCSCATRCVSSIAIYHSPNNAFDVTTCNSVQPSSEYIHERF